LEQPSSWLARIFVGVLLVSVATVILVAFNLLERSVRARLEAFGLNTLIAREMITQQDAELVVAGERGDRFGPLSEMGRKVTLRQLFSRAHTDVQQHMLVMTYAPEAAPQLQPLMGSSNGILCLSESLREDLVFNVTFNRQDTMATVRRPDNFLRPLVQENILLIPQGWAPEAERAGFMETVVFQRDENAPPMAAVVNAINNVYALDRRNAPQLNTPLHLVRELETLQKRQAQWRLLLASLLGLAVALVYGAIAVLEFRQNQYVTALLRSFGTPKVFLYLRHWAENAFLANVAAAAAIFTIASLHGKLFGTLGFPFQIVQPGSANPYLSIEIALILLCVNAGAILSSLPVAFGLRRQVGEILN